MPAPLAQDATLDEIREAIAGAIAPNAAFDGWTANAVAATADSLGIDRDIAAILFPGGAVDMIDAWFASVDRNMAERLPPERLASMKIRERITALVEARLDILAPDREALRRAIALLAMPQNMARGARLGWRSADRMWRLAGDTATDYNHYTKRAMLGGVYAATLTVFLDDESEGHAATRAFLARRIEDIMRFERAKARFLGRDTRHFSLSRFVGRLRYPAV